jgi:hypothetical protein
MAAFFSRGNAISLDRALADQDLHENRRWNRALSFVSLSSALKNAMLDDRAASLGR